MFKPVVPSVFRLALGMVNAYLLDTPHGAWLIDTGDIAHGPTIIKALQHINLTPAQLRGIIITHLHYDHSGGLAYLQQNGAPVALMHPLDADQVRQGVLMRQPFTLTPPLNLAQGWFDAHPVTQPMGQPAYVDGTAVHGVSLDDVIDVIETPGHSAGHISLLYHMHGGVLIGGDVCMHVLGLRRAVGHEDEQQAAISRRRIGTYEYDTLIVGHGTPLVGRASAKVRQHFDA
jgi:glyoxylase-like metal-dependent hydrolase (beta-lactamase superfamily II)